MFEDGEFKYDPENITFLIFKEIFMSLNKVLAQLSNIAEYSTLFYII